MAWSTRTLADVHFIGPSLSPSYSEWGAMIALNDVPVPEGRTLNDVEAAFQNLGGKLDYTHARNPIVYADDLKPLHIDDCPSCSCDAPAATITVYARGFFVDAKLGQGAEARHKANHQAVSLARDLADTLAPEPWE